MAEEVKRVAAVNPWAGFSFPHSRVVFQSVSNGRFLRLDGAASALAATNEVIPSNSSPYGLFVLTWHAVKISIAPAAGSKVVLEPSGRLVGTGQYAPGKYEQFEVLRDGDIWKLRATSNGKWVGLVGNELFANRDSAETAEPLRYGLASLEDLPNLGEVFIYEGDHFTGKKWVFHGDTPYAVINSQGLNDKASSVKVGPKTKVILYEHDFSGRQIEVRGNVPSLEDLGFGHITSSLKLTREDSGSAPEEEKSLQKPYLFSFKHAYGVLCLDSINPDAINTKELWRTDVADHWDYVEPFHVGPNSFLFFYKKEDGTAAINKIDPTTQRLTETYRARWANDWTNFAFYYIDGQTILFSFKHGAGTACFDRIKEDGTGYDNVRRVGWNGDWTHFSIFQIEGKPHLFSYKNGDRTGCVDQLAADGTTREIWRDHLDNNYDYLVSFSLGSEWNLLAYKSGAVSLYTFDPRGVPVKVSSESWASNWTNFNVFYITNQPYLLTFKKGVGTVTTNQLTKKSGTLAVVELWRATWNADWTHFATTNF